MLSRFSELPLVVVLLGMGALAMFMPASHALAIDDHECLAFDLVGFEQGLGSLGAGCFDREAEAAWKSFRNLPNVHVIAVDQLNTYDVLVADYLVFDKDTLVNAGAATAGK